jgi:hypothetical protein
MLAAVVAAAGAARAAEPPCFPERTVAATVSLTDERGRVFGGLRAGAPVRVRDEPDVGAHGDDRAWADVELAEPLAVAGRTGRRKLVVFARADIEVQPGLAWLMAGAPLEVLSGDAQRARVVLARSLEDHDALTLPPVEVSCALLRGAPPPEIVEWDTLGPLRRDHHRFAGRPVDWDGKRELESDAGARSAPLHGGVSTLDERRRAAVLVRFEGARALVEVVDHYNWSRHRGWTPRDGLRFVRKRVPEAICGCAEGEGWLRLAFWAPRRLVRLRAPTPLLAVADGRTLATLPAGTPVGPLSVIGDESLVVWTAPRTKRPGLTPQLLLFGHVPTAALGPVDAAAVNAAVEGQLAPELAGAPFVVRAQWQSGDVSFPLRVSVEAHGSFRLVSPVNRGRLRIWAETPTGHRLSDDVTAQLAPGKTAHVLLPDVVPLQ